MPVLHKCAEFYVHNSSVLQQSTEECLLSPYLIIQEIVTDKATPAPLSINYALYQAHKRGKFRCKVKATKSRKVFWTENLHIDKKVLQIPFSYS
jgi:hypothetical protein